MSACRLLRLSAGATAVAAIVGLVRARREAADRREGRRPHLGPDGLVEPPPGEPSWGRAIAAWTPGRPAGTPARLLSAVWAGPMSLLGLVFAALGRGQWRFDPDHGALVVTDATGPSQSLLAGIGAQAVTMGHVIVSRAPQPSPQLLEHEAQHVRQAERLGPLLPVAYAWAGAMFGYEANPFERAARTAARRTLRPAG